MEAIALRLKPQQDLKAELDDFVAKQQIEAACILTCVGSLSEANLRFANQPEGTLLPGKLEIVSLTGVMSMHGSHYHLAIADSTGRTIGGHLLKGCLIYTTAEIIIGILPQYRFKREYDAASGFRELVIDSIESAVRDRANPLS
ncbi:MAG: DNA-binding protein [Microcoleus sp. SIO2G3]|nr:DNA-binding protein [Microcoleus sp. SIO2G3]